MSDIGVWQTTTQIEQESSDPSVTAEDKARDTLDALDEIPTLTQELANDASRYDLHTKLIELLERADMPDQLEFARQQMHKIYPLPESMWLNWLQDAKKRGDEDGLKQLYEEANKDYLSIPIWKDFVDYTLEKFYAKWREDGILVEKEEDVVDLIESTRNDLLKAVKATRNHVAQSHEIWNPYADFERQILEKFKKPEQFEKLKELYKERLEIVHIACEETFSKYSNLISSWDNANYEDNMVQSNKIYAATKEAAEERDYYERKLVDSGYAMDAFYEYIEYEKNSQKKPSLNYVQNLYERAIAIYCTDVILWNDYICFLLEKVRVFPILETIILRALRNCPWSGLLWGHLVRVMELENRSKEQILEIFERALSNATLRSSLEDLVSLFLAKCDYLRNNTDWEDQNSIADLRVAFEEAMLFIDESFPETGDPYFRIEKRYAFVEGYRLKNFAKSTELWEKIVKRYGQSTDAWLEYIQFERMMGRTNICRGLFRRGLPKNIDQPQKFIDAYMAFEHELGTADTIADMLVRVSKKNRTLAAQWQEAQGAEAMEATAVAYYEALKSRPAKEKRKRGPRSAAAGRKQRQRYPKQDNQERFEQRYSVESSQEEDAEAKQIIEEKDTEPQQTIEEGKDVETEANIPVPEVSVDTADQPAAKKRKASVAELSEGDTEDMSEGSAKRPRTMNEERGRGRTRGLGRGPRQRGRSRKAISLARPTSRQQPQQQSSSSQQSEQEEVAPAPAAPKSNQDFRAMLLGKK